MLSTSYINNVQLFPGPGVLFKDVLQQVQKEFTDWNNTGMSIVELSHRSVHFAALMQDAKSNLRKLVNIPDEYDVLFVQGGATQVFSSLPMNLSRPEDTVDYVVNGYWSRFAAEEATKHVAKVNLAALDETGTSCPHPSTWRLTPNAAYVHYCSNETINGCEYHEVPDIDNNVPLVCDMSSDFLSKPIDVRRFGMIYAGAHKNIGPAGMTVIVIKKRPVASLQQKLTVHAQLPANVERRLDVQHTAGVLYLLCKLGVQTDY